MAEDIETHEYIAKAGGGRCLVALQTHKALDIQREATRAIANLLSSFRHQGTIMEDGMYLMYLYTYILYYIILYLHIILN